MRVCINLYPVLSRQNVLDFGGHMFCRTVV